MLHSPQCKFMKWVSSCPIREVSYPPHTHTPVQPAQEPAPVQPPQEPAAVPEFPIDDLNMLIRGFDEQALRPPAPLQTLASYSKTLAGALISAAVAVPFGVGLVLRGAATLLEQLATLQQANDTALLLAIDVALVVEIFSGLRRHGFEPANSPFWSGAGRLHLAMLRKVSVFNPQTKLYNTLTSVVLAQAFTDAVTNYNDRMSCCPYLTGSGLKVMDLDAASGALEKARRHFVDALLVNLSEAALESVGKINRRQLGIRGDLVLTGRTGNTATFFEPVVLQGNAPVPPIDGVCMGFTGKKIRCTHPATRAFRVISTRYHDGQGTMVPINPSYVLHVCGNHGRVGGFLERMGDAVVPM